MIYYGEPSDYPEPIDCPDCGDPEATYDDAGVHCPTCDGN